MRLRLLLLLVSVVTTYAAPPSVLFILADDLGWNDVSYNGAEIPTPTIDKLSAEGVRLTSYYVQQLCTPTRSALLTGRYPIHLGMQSGVILPSQPYGLGLDEELLPQRLRTFGYRSHIVGKWHLGFHEEAYIPTNRGFESYYGQYLGQKDYYTHNASDTVQGQTITGFDQRRGVVPTWEDTGKYSPFLWVNEVQQIIRQHDESSPLFMYFPLQLVHAPNQVPDEYVSKTKCSTITNTARRMHCGMTVALDEVVANVSTLFQQKFADGIIIFSTDNGGPTQQGANNLPLRGGKNTLFEGGVRGVSWVWSNRLQKKGVNYDGIIHVTDWFPTLVGLAERESGIKSPLSLKVLDGVDQWEAISTGAASARQEVLLNINPVDGSYAIRVGNWKLINEEDADYHDVPTIQETKMDADTKNKTVPFLWLFDLAENADIQPEYTNLALENLDLVAELANRVDYYRNTMVAPRNKPGTLEADPANFGGVWSPWQ